jgi:small GTP-binding protein
LRERLGRGASSEDRLAASKGSKASGLASRAIPATLSEIRELLRAVDWDELGKEVEEEAQAHIAIIGPVNSGKSTLFNLLKGRRSSPVSAVPGTTRSLISERMGPFTLTDTPGFGEVDGVDRANIAIESIRDADLVILLLDAAAGLRQSDRDLHREVRRMGRPVVLALNKIDLVRGDLSVVLADAVEKLGVTDIIPISAKRGTNVASRLVPSIIDKYPHLAVAIGRELPLYRRQASRRVIRNATALAAVLGTEPVPFLDVPFLLANLARMVVRVAAIYGESLTARHAGELTISLMSGLAFRYLAQQASKFLPGPGWVIAGGVAAAGTWSIGRVAQEYFDGGKQMSMREIRRRYGQLMKRWGEGQEEPPDYDVCVPLD